MNVKSSVNPKANYSGQSLADIAYEEIKLMIIAMELHPGEYLNEAQLSNALGIGRTPVHQAITRLALDGMIEIIPRKGVIIKSVSLNEILQIIDVRILNEVHCVRLAAKNADKTDIEQLEDILRRSEIAANERDFKQLMLLDKEFHLSLSRASKNIELAAILQRLHDRSLRFWFISLTNAKHFRAVLKEHAEIYSAIKNQDADLAEQKIREHIISFKEQIVRHI